MMSETDKTIFRHTVLARIRRTLEESFQESPEVLNSTAIQIMGDTPTAILDSGNYLKSIQPFVTKVENCMGSSCPSAQTRFLAVEIHKRHSYFVLDINNYEYDYESAH